MKIVVHIERLVLEGLPVTSAQGPRLRRAVEHELTRLLASGGVDGPLSGGGALARVEAPQLHIQPRERPDALGRRIAGSVYGGIRRT